MNDLIDSWFYKVKRCDNDMGYRQHLNYVLQYTQYLCCKRYASSSASNTHLLLSNT
jgi:hypothetical protein